MGFAGENSDVQLALAPLDERSIREYRARVHASSVARGRRPEDVKILFAIQPVLVSSTEEADRIVAASQHPDDATLLRVARRQSSDLETDLTTLDLDARIDGAIFGDHVSEGSIQRLLGSHGAGASLRTVLTAHARAGRLNDGTGFVGTADEFADRIEELGEWGNDGVLLWGDLQPVTVHRALDDLVPILRSRGILREDIRPGPLRDNFFAF